MQENQTDQDTTISELEEIKIRYLKSNYFRVIHADGAWGGVSPKGNIHISFYNERGALPDGGRITVSEDGRVQQPEEYHASSRIVRELECDVILDLTAARGLQVWLNDRVQALQDLVDRAIKNQAITEKASETDAQKMAK